MVNVKIYTKTSCPYCVKAKMLLDKYQINYEEILITTPEQKEKLVEKTNWMSVPQIFINETFIGGCDDLYKLEEEGKLKSMLSN